MSATESAPSGAERAEIATIRRVSKPHFRAGVVIVVRRGDGRVLAFERVDTPGAWQLPQGGIEYDETPERAAWRELHEETGLDADSVRLVSEHTDWTAYVWPPDFRRKGRLGQAHRWFFFEPMSDEIEPTPDGHEFGAWAWFDVDALIDQVVDFRKPCYEQVLGG